MRQKTLAESPLNLAKSIDLPVYLQDERLTSLEAMENLKAEGLKPDEIPALIDGEAAAMILRDFLDTTAGTNTRLIPNRQLERQQMKRLIILIIVVGVLAVAGFGAWVYSDLRKPITHAKTGQYIDIPKRLVSFSDHQEADG